MSRVRLGQLSARSEDNGICRSPFANATIVNVAAPSITRSLHTSTASLQWIITGYTLTFSVMLVTGGRLGDILGRKNIFVTGLCGFVAASTLCSLAQSPGMLIGSRLLQGGFAALMVPQAFALIKAVFKPAQVAGAFAVFGPFMGLSAILGPVVGGALVTAGGWRWIFLINVPAGLVTIAAAIRVLPPRDARGGAIRLDLAGMALATGAAVLLVYPLVEGRPAGWPAWSFAMMAVAAPVLALLLCTSGRAVGRAMTLSSRRACSATARSAPGPEVIRFRLARAVDILGSPVPRLGYTLGKSRFPHGKRHDAAGSFAHL